MSTFSHTGAIGDLIYALPTIRAAGGGILYLRAGDTQWMRGRYRDSLIPLLEAQPYIQRVEITNAPAEYNLDAWRSHYREGMNIAEMTLRTFGLAPCHAVQPWITVEPRRISRVVFHRSPRYRNERFPWKRAVEKYCGKAIFVGLTTEHAEFVSAFGAVPHYPTTNHLELAQIIAGADLFIGNQSSPYAIAEALKMRSVLEVCLAYRNCTFNRSNGIYGLVEHTYLPDL